MVEEQIRTAEQAVVLESMKEVMWGGKSTEGLVYVVSQMRESVTDLVRMVKTVVSDVNGSDGVRSEMRSLRSEISTLRSFEDRIEARKDKDHQTINDHLRKMEARMDRLEAVKIDLETVKDWRIDSLKAREDASHRLDKIETRLDERLDALRKEMEEQASRGASKATAWAGIAVSTIIGVIALLRPH